jgi:hypothetical protein
MGLALEQLQNFKLTVERFSGVSDFSIDSAKSACQGLAQKIESMKENLGKIPSLKTPLKAEEVWSKFKALNFEINQLSKLEIRTLLSSEDHAFREEILIGLESSPQVFTRFRLLYCFASMYFLLWWPEDGAQRIESLILSAIKKNKFAHPLAKLWINRKSLFSPKAATTLAEKTCEGRLAAFQLTDQCGVGRHTKLSLEVGGVAASMAVEIFKRLDRNFSEEESLHFLRWVTDQLLTEQTLMGPKSDLVATLILSQSAQKSSRFRKAVLGCTLADPRLGDPRLVKNTANWGSIDGTARARVISWLADESIRFFFDIVLPKHHENQRRKDFWLKYVDKVRDFQIALSDTDLKKIKSKATLPQYLVYSRADHDLISAFLMRFDGYFKQSITVVEFSQTGNAAYVYEDKSYKINLNKHSYRIHSDLKVMHEVSTRIIHNGDWEAKAAHSLSASFGINP